MNSLIKFIQKYSNFLVFLLLEVVAFMLLVSNREYPKSYVLSSANRIAASHYERVQHIRSYFDLRQVNTELAAENVRLRNQLVQYANIAEHELEQPTYQYSHLDYSYEPAKVVHAITNQQANTLTINKGRRDSVYQGMGVCNGDGVIGIVATVGERFSVVIPMISVQSHVSCMFAKNNYCGTIEWLGNDIRHVQVIDVATHVDVAEGDTLVTSGLTAVFPSDIPIAVVEKAIIPQGASYYSISARVLPDFKRLNYVQLIRNNAQIELENLQHESRP